MNEGTRTDLEEKLKRMIKNLDQAEARRKQAVPGSGNIIRRRKGEKDKRFST